MPIEVSYVGSRAVDAVARHAERDVGQEDTAARDARCARALSRCRCKPAQLRPVASIASCSSLREVRRDDRNAERVRRLDRRAEHAAEQPVESRARVRDAALVGDQIVLRLRRVDLPLHHIEPRHGARVEARLRLLHEVLRELFGQRADPRGAAARRAASRTPARSAQLRAGAGARSCASKFPRSPFAAWPRRMILFGNGIVIPTPISVSLPVCGCVSPVAPRKVVEIDGSGSAYPCVTRARACATCSRATASVGLCASASRIASARSIRSGADAESGACAASGDAPDAMVATTASASAPMSRDGRGDER